MDQTSKPRPSLKKKAAQKDASRIAREEARRVREEERAAREEERIAREQAAREEREAQEAQALEEEIAAREAYEEELVAREQAAREQAARQRIAREVRNPEVPASGFRDIRVPDPLEEQRAVADGFPEANAGRNPRQEGYADPATARGYESLDRFAQGNGSAVGMNAAQSYKRKRNLLGVLVRFLAALLAAAVLASVAVLGILTIAEYRPRDTVSLEVANPVQTMLQSEQSFSILTWNVGYAGQSANQTSFLDGGAGVQAESAEVVKANMSAMENVVADQNCDFIFLQEVDRASDRSFKVNEEKSVTMSMEALNRSSVFAQDFKATYVPYPWPFLGAVDSGSMTESRYKVESAERIALTSAQSWPMSLVSPNACVLVEKLPIEGSSKKLVLMNVRFDDHASEEVNDAQARELALLMKREADKGNYVIAGGDFDQNFSSTDVKAYGEEISRIRSTGVLDERLFAEGMQFEMDSSTPTMRSMNAAYEGEGSNVRFYVSDGFIVSSNVTVDGVVTIDEGFRNSDHNPVKLNVTLS